MTCLVDRLHYPEARAIVEYLRDHGPISKSYAQAALGISPKKYGEVFDRLVETDFVACAGTIQHPDWPSHVMVAYIAARPASELDTWSVDKIRSLQAARPAGRPLKKDRAPKGPKVLDDRDKAELRERLAEDVERFLAQGRRIEKHTTTQVAPTRMRVEAPGARHPW